NRYNFDDNDIEVNGQYRYRLSQTDFDGVRTELGIVNIEISRSNDWSVQLYPNPAKGNSKVVVNTVKGSTVQADIYDNTGRMVVKGTSQDVEENGNVEIILDLVTLTQGMYFVKVVHDNESQIVRLMVID